jgi:hypothetical protein
VFQRHEIGEQLKRNHLRNGQQTGRTLQQSLTSSATSPSFTLAMVITFAPYAFISRSSCSAFSRCKTEASSPWSTVARTTRAHSRRPVLSAHVSVGPFVPLGLDIRWDGEDPCFRGNCTRWNTRESTARPHRSSRKIFAGRPLWRLEPLAPIYKEGLTTRTISVFLHHF